VDTTTSCLSAAVPLRPDKIISGAAAKLCHWVRCDVRNNDTAASARFSPSWSRKTSLKFESDSRMCGPLPVLATLERSATEGTACHILSQPKTPLIKQISAACSSWKSTQLTFNRGRR